MTTLQRTAFALGPLGAVVLFLMLRGEFPSLAATAAVAWWMLVWWLTEAVAIYVTALLPMVFFPLLGVMPTAQTFAAYGDPIVFLFLGGFVVGLALEESGLHERIAFFLIRLFGGSLRGTLGGFMLATMALSMWISNTATAIMMIPMALSVHGSVSTHTDDNVAKRFTSALLLGVGYAASLGGMMTLIGTPPNMVFAGLYAAHTGHEFGFARWLAVGVPVGFVATVLAFLLLLWRYRIPALKPAGLHASINERYRQLGPPSRKQWMVAAVFAITVCGWVAVEPVNLWLGKTALTNTGVAMMGALLLLCTPVSVGRGEFIVNWKSTQKIPWGILLLFGGGLSLAAALQSAGFIEMVGAAVFSPDAHPLLLLAVLVPVTIVLTELMSNVALVTVFLPVVFAVAGSGTDNEFLAVAVTLAASAGFMMPVSTPPNALVFGTGHIKLSDMVKTGLWLNLLVAALIVAAAALW